MLPCPQFFNKQGVLITRVMFPKYVIYALQDPMNRRIRYVGYSTRGAVRPCLRHGGYCGRWQAKLAREGRVPNILVLTAYTKKPTATRLKNRERYWIRTLRAQNCDLTNLTDGGDGSSGYRHDSRFRKTLVMRNKAWWAIPANKRHMSITAKARAAAPGVRAELTKRAIKRYRDPKERRWLSDKATRQWANPAIRLKNSRSHGGRSFVDQFGRRYATVGEASKRLGIIRSGVQGVLKNRRRQASGFTFKYCQVLP